MTALAEATFLQRTTSSFRSRNFRLFFIGQTVSNTGNWLTMVALTLLVLHRTGSGVAVGVLSACQFGPILVLSPWAGVVIDRSNKRTLLIVMQSLQMAQSFGLAALAFSGHAPLGLFYAAATVGGCLLAFDNPVRRSFVSEMVEPEDVPNAVTLYSAMVNIARIVGPAMAGVLVIAVGYGWCFTIDAATYTAVLVALAMMRPHELRRVAVASRGRGQVRAGLAYVRSVPELWVTFAMLLIVGSLSWNFTVIFPLFVEHGLHGSDADYTFIYAAFSAGSLVGALLVARRPTITVRTVTLDAALFGVALLALSVMPDVPLALLVAVAVGAASVAYITGSTAIAQLVADPQMTGRVIALQTVLIVGTTPLGGPILGAVADSVGARWPVVVGGVGALVAAALGYFSSRVM